MNMLKPHHGGRGTPGLPGSDLSTNANPLGPCPALLEAVRAADFTRYPDYEYNSLRDRLAAWHRTRPECIVVGPGASELILRLVRRHDGPVRVLGPTFSEYARCARLERRPVFETSELSSFAAIQRCDGGLGFACWPNSPTGEAWSLPVLAEASRRGTLVVDLAYGPLCGPSALREAESLLTQAIRLYSPNKSFGMTGVRAAYLVLPEPDERLQWGGASWCLDAAGEAFLAEACSQAAQDWLEVCVPVLQARRSELAQALRLRGYAVTESPANFLLAQLGEPLQVQRALKARGLQVRDASSFGLPGWHRIAAPVSPAIGSSLLEALADMDPLLSSFQATGSFA